jgi:HEAT repeat protein
MPLAETLQFLAETENEAAVPVLLAGLHAPQRRLPKQVLQSLLQRSSPTAEMEVLVHWHEWKDGLRTLLHRKPDWLSGAIRAALAGPRDPATGDQLFRNACDAALRLNDFDQIPALAIAAADRTNPNAQIAADAVLILAERLFDELHAPRDYRVRRDPQLQRANLLPTLEHMVDCVYQHQCLELVEALLLLAERDTASIKRILQSPRDPNFAAVSKVLQRSTRPGVIRLLLSYLDDPHAPRPAMISSAGRCDLQFIRHLLRKVGNQPPQVVRNNLRRIDEIPWLSYASDIYAALSESEQAAAIQVVSEANLPQSRALQLLSLGLQDGSSAGRRAAAAGLVKFSGAEAEEIAWQALDDDDPVVRAQAVIRMGKNATPTVIPRLLEMLDSPHQPEREAAQACLNEYSFERYLQAYDTMSPESRLATGLLVKKVDPTIIAGLTTELQANVRVRCERALDIIVTLQMVPDLLPAIEALLQDEDQYTRLAAVRTLATCDIPESIVALRRVRLDHSPLVAQAAEEALSRFAAQAAANEAAAEPEAEEYGAPSPSRGTTPLHELDFAASDTGF